MEGQAMRGPLASNDAVTRVMHGQPVDFVPVAQAYENLGPLQYYLVERSWRKWWRKVEASGAELLPVSYEETLDQQFEIQAEMLRDIYLRPAWRALPHNETPEQVSGCAVLRRGEDLFWVRPDGNTSWMQPTLVGQEVRYGAGWSDLWDRSQDLSAVTAAAAEPAHAVGPLPEPAEAQVEAVAQSPIYDLARRLAAAFPDELPFYAYAGTPYNSLPYRFGFQTLMFALTERPEQIHAILERALPQPMARLLGERRLGVSLMHVEECLASADIISPQMYREFVFPYTKAALAFWEGLGYRTMLYFSGNLMPFLKDLRELPFTAICFEENRKSYGIDLAEVRRVIGPDKVLFGNMDASFVEQASDDEVRAEARRQIDVAGSRNFILSVGSPFTPGTTLERVRLVTGATRNGRV
jgi:Uroporphyrinogen decarboxylase (URO-D)